MCVTVILCVGCGAYQIIKNSSYSIWKTCRITWKNSANLPVKCWITSIAELDGKVYVALSNVHSPYMYDIHMDHWSKLAAMPSTNFSIVSVKETRQILVIGGVTRQGKANKNVFVLLIHPVHVSKGDSLTRYPDMPTARYKPICISYRSSVIVAGGITDLRPLTKTRAVEILHISKIDVYWYIAEPLPHVANEAIPLIIKEDLYIAGGFDEDDYHTRNVVTASLQRLFQSFNYTNSGQVWNKLPDMPYCCHSIFYYKENLITITGNFLSEQRNDKGILLFCKALPLIHLYNPLTMCWDCVGECPHGYCLGRSVHVNESKILFVGGAISARAYCYLDNEDNLVTKCMMLSIDPHHSTLIDNHY